MNKEEFEQLDKLFWKYCQTFDEYDEFVKKKYTRKEILKDIENNI